MKTRLPNYFGASPLNISPKFEFCRFNSRFPPGSGIASSFLFDISSSWGTTHQAAAERWRHLLFVEIASGLFGRVSEQLKFQKTSIAFHGGLTNLPSIARLLSASERDCALECRPNSFREHCAQATFLHLVNRFGGSATR